MNSKSTTRKAEGLGSREKRKAETLEAEIRSSSVPQFENEEQFLDGLKAFMQAGRQCSAPGMDRIVRFWERKITFSILVAQQRLQRSKAVKVLPDGDHKQRVPNGTAASSHIPSTRAE